MAVRRRVQVDVRAAQSGRLSGDPLEEGTGVACTADFAAA